MAGYGLDIRPVIKAGGIPKKNDVLNQVYANLLGHPVLELVSLGSAISCFSGCGTFKTI
jgi:L-ribulokinase